MKNKPHIVVIGAGFGGMSAACYLAKAGFRVTVVEKNPAPGGRAMVMKKQGFLFDLGPSWYMMPDVFDDFFADFGHTTNDFFQLKQLNPSYQVFTDTAAYRVPPAPEVYSFFDSVAPGAGQQLKQLLQKTEREYNAIRTNILERPQLGFHENANKVALSLLTDPELVRSYHSRINKYITHPDLQKILEFMVVFMGGSPKNIPALYSLLSYVDFGLGIHYPMGGFGKLVEAYYTVARSLGVEFKFHHNVTRIVTQKCHVTGVETANAGIIEADLVVSNADYAYTEMHLLDDRVQSYSDGYWQRRVVSPSGLLVYLGVNKKLDGLLHHNLFFDAEWDGHFREVFKTKQWSKEPLFYLSAPSRTDSSVAPPGKENLFVLAPMANGSQPNQAIIDATVNRIIARIERKIGTPFARDIIVKDVRAHNYFKTMFHAYQGNAFGLAHTLRQSAHLRPKMKSPSVEGLYHVGQFTNPGTGVPIVTISGKVVSNLITQQWRKK